MRNATDDELKAMKPPVEPCIDSRLEAELLLLIESAVNPGMIKPSWILSFIRPAIERKATQERNYFYDLIIQSRRPVQPDGVGDLVEHVKGLIEYREHAGPLNFQLEKADTFIFRMRVALEQMGELQAPSKPENRS